MRPDLHSCYLSCWGLLANSSTTFSACDFLLFFCVRWNSYGGSTGDGGGSTGHCEPSK